MASSTLILIIALKLFHGIHLQAPNGLLIAWDWETTGLVMWVKQTAGKILGWLKRAKGRGWSLPQI